LKKHEGAANQYNATFADMQEKGELWWMTYTQWNSLLIIVS
jgi:hypothetical protein